MSRRTSKVAPSIETTTFDVDIRKKSFRNRLAMIDEGGPQGPSNLMKRRTVIYPTVKPSRSLFRRIFSRASTEKSSEIVKSLPKKEECSTDFMKSMMGDIHKCYKKSVANTGVLPMPPHLSRAMSRRIAPELMTIPNTKRRSNKKSSQASRS